MPAVGLLPQGVAVSPDGSHAYVTSEHSNTVSVIAWVTNAAGASVPTVVATVPVGDGPIGVAVTPDGARVYVANINSSTVSVIDTATNSVVATVEEGLELRSNLTLNIGLRQEFSTGWNEVSGRAANYITDSNGALQTNVRIGGSAFTTAVQPTDSAGAAGDGSADGSGSAESCPHASQNRPLTGIPQAGHAFASAEGGESGCAAGLPIGAPHTSQ